MISTGKQLIALVFILIFWGCEKEENRSTSIPGRPVYIDINTTLEHDFNNPYYSKIYPDQGYGGVIVISYYDYNNNTNLTLGAFDLSCPYEANASNKVEQKGKTEVECPKCKSIFEIGDGTGKCKSGPSTERLRSYYISKDGSTYRIRN